MITSNVTWVSTVTNFTDELAQLQYRLRETGRYVLRLNKQLSFRHNQMGMLLQMKLMPALLQEYRND
jgi:hypothetical protein